MTQVLLRVLVGLFVAWLLVVVLAAVFQRQIIYLPDTSVPHLPDDVVEVTLTTGDGLTLTSWLLETAGEPASTILVAPGNAGNRGLRLPLARGLVARGHDVLLLEHRGYGGNPGTPSEPGLRADAAAAHRHLVADRGVDPGRLVHLGESLGSAVAARLTADAPAAGLVLRSPFPSLVEVGRRQFPFLPVGTLLRDRFATADALADVAVPVLVVAGEADRTVPSELSAQVAEVADAELIALPGVDHNDRGLLDGERYLDAVDRFARAAVGAAPG